MRPGERIRERRRELGLTQAALAGDCITRNMLSQIEEGKASPSLATLQYLADRLGMPMGYFFCAEGEEFFYRKMTCFPHLLKLFHAGSYAECLRTFEKELGECDDELGLMMASCAFACGKKAWHNGAFDSAVAYLTSAEDYAAETAYPTDWLRAGCRLLLPIAMNVQAPQAEFNEPAYLDALRDAGCMDVYAYLMEKEDHVFENACYGTHLEARRRIRAGGYAEALPFLDAIEAQKGAPEISAFLLFRVYTDLEICHRECGNYEAAYRYSSKRLTLLNAFRT